MRVTSPAPRLGVNLRWDKDSAEEQLGREMKFGGGLSSASCSPRGAAAAAKAPPAPFMPERSAQPRPRCQHPPCPQGHGDTAACHCHSHGLGAGGIPGRCCHP